jgi:hypothetical protein
MENEAKEEEAKDKEIQAEIVRKTSLKKKMGMTGMEKRHSSSDGQDKEKVGEKERPRPKGKQLSGVEEGDEHEAEVVVDEDDATTPRGVEMDARGRASKFISSPAWVYRSRG